MFDHDTYDQASVSPKHRGYTMPSTQRDLKSDAQLPIDFFTETTSSPASRPEVATTRRVVVKLGTRVLTEQGVGLASRRLAALVSQIAWLRQSGREVILVSSGAVGIGREEMGLQQPPDSFELKQACAAVGQSRLLAFYERQLARHGMRCGQLLLTEQDFDLRPRYLELRQTLQTLLKHGVIPVLNENDAVTRNALSYLPGRDQQVFGDNDRLAALIATKLDADLLLLLTDVDGVYDHNPLEHPDARLLHRLDEPSLLELPITPSVDGFGRGGMRSKVEAAVIAARGGCHTVIASGLEPPNLWRAAAGEDIGTWIPARGSLAARRRWIAFATAARGVLHLDDGAVEALCQRRASLLPVGVRQVEGDFHRGDVVELRGSDGVLVGRGVVLYDAEVVRHWSTAVAPTDLRNPNALIRRSELVLEKSYPEKSP